MEAGGFSDVAVGGTNVQSEKSLPPPQVIPMESQSRYDENPQPPSYGDQERAMHAGYGPDPRYHYQLPAQPGPQPVMQQPMPLQQQSTTTVIVNQAPVPEIQLPRNWTTGMCDCFSDCGICLMVTFCGECYGCCCFMDNIKESCCLPFCFPMGWMGAARAKIRNKYNIQGSLMDDFCMTSGCCACFTRSCVFCQMAREVKIQTELGNPI